MNPYTIKNHQLYKNGKLVKQEKTPNKNGTCTPKLLIMHYTAVTTAQSSINWFGTKGSDASAHILIDQEGHVWQFAPFNIRTYHAGVSSWQCKKDLNYSAIGIEMVNAGWLEKVVTRTAKGQTTTYRCPTDREPVDSYQKHGDRYWHAYTAEQIQAAHDIAEVLKSTYKLSDILGHSDVAPTRKIDPGPAFNWKWFQDLGLKHHKL